MSQMGTIWGFFICYNIFMNKSRANLIPWILIVLILIGSGIFAAIRLRQNKLAQQKQAAAQALAPYLNFSDEVYDTIRQNYWDKISDDQLTGIYLLAANKINTSTVQILLSKDKDGLNALITDEVKNLDPNKKKDFVHNFGQRCSDQSPALWPQFPLYPGLGPGVK